MLGIFALLFSVSGAFASLFVNSVSLRVHYQGQANSVCTLVTSVSCDEIGTQTCTIEIINPDNTSLVAEAHYADSDCQEILANSAGSGGEFRPDTKVVSAD